MTNDRKKFLKRSAISFAVILLCELIIFNITSIISLFDDDHEIALDLAGSSRSGISYVEESGILLVPEDTEGYVIFRNIGSHISTIRINANTTAPETVVKFSYNEGTNTDNLRPNGKISIIRGNKLSQYTLCSFSGETNTLKLYFTTGVNETIEINSVDINSNIPFEFSFTRVALISLLTIFIIALTTLEEFSLSISKSNSFKLSCAAVILIFLSFVLALSAFASRGLYKDFTDPLTNQINKELVDAFEAGQVHLLKDVEPELLALENPYDWSQRTAAGINSSWDHCLYNGQYYSYYGIAPVLLIFLPYHLITGLYFPSVWAICIFALLGVLFLGMTYYKIVKIYFPKLPLNVALIGLIIIELSSGIWFSIPIEKFYEIAQSSGFAFTAMGAYFLISSNAISEGRLSRVKAAFASIFLALSVLCRPTLAVYCVVSLIFIAIGAKKAYSENKLSSTITYLLSALIPYVVIGGVQMAYNYLRFDSFFDFGIQYSLTINDFTATEFHIPQVLIGFYNYLFASPVINSEFPFIHSGYDLLGVNGYYYSANKNAIGIIFRALPVVSYVFSIKAYKINKSKKTAILLASSCIIAPLVIIFSIWESGYGVRYCADFSWQILMGALLIAYYLYDRFSPQIKKVCTALMFISLICCLVSNFAMVYSYVLANAYSSVRVILLSFGRLFEFWNMM